MPTINQLIRKGRERQVKKSMTPIMGQCPQNTRHLPLGDDDFSQEA